MKEIDPNFLDFLENLYLTNTLTSDIVCAHIWLDRSCSRPFVRVDWRRKAADWPDRAGALSNGAATMEALFTRQEAAARLRVSTKTLDKHVAAGVLRYVSIGLGRQHIRRMFAPPTSRLLSKRKRERMCRCVRQEARQLALLPLRVRIPRSSLSRLNQGHVKAGGRRSRAPRARQGEGGCRSAQGRLDLAPARRRRRTLLAGDRSASRRRRNTWKLVERLVEFFGKDRLITDITGDDVAQLVAWRRGQRVERGGKNGPYCRPSPSTTKPCS